MDQADNVYGPLLHGNGDFQFMRIKARAVSNYGAAKQTKET